MGRDAPDSAQRRGGPTRWRIEPIRLLWLASPVALPLLHALSPWIPEALRALAGLAFLLLAPGWLLHLLIYPRARIGLAARLSRTFALSLAVISIFGLAAWFVGRAGGPTWASGLTAVLCGVGGWLLVGAVLLVARGRRRGATGEAPDPAGDARLRGDGVPGGAGATSGETPAAGRAGGEIADEERAGPEPGGLDPANPRMQRLMREAYRLGDQHKADHPIAPRWATLLVLCVMMLTASILGIYAGGITSYQSDAPGYLASLREMTTTDRILPLTAFHIDGDGIATDPRLGFFQVAVAAAARLTGTDPVRMWHLMPGLLIPLALGVFHSYARRLLRSEGSALFATFLALICFAEATHGPFARLGYASHMGLVLSWASLTLALDYVVVRPRPAHLWLLALAAFAAVATHLFAGILVLFSLGVYLLAMLLFRPRRHPGTGRLKAALLAAAAGCLLPMLWRCFYTLPTVNPIHNLAPGLLQLSPGLFIVQPLEWAHLLTGAGLGAILLSFFLWRRAREEDALLYMVSLSIAPLLLVANPLVVPLLAPRLGYLLARFVLAVPFLLVLAYMARWMGESLLALTSLRRILVSLVFYAFMVVLLFPRLEAFARSFSTARLEQQRARSVMIWQDLLDRLVEEAPEPAVVLSDPLTSYSIPALTDHYVVAVLGRHASPADSLALQRLAACRDVLSPYVGAGEKARLCRRFRVDYVLLNAAVEQPLSLFFCDVGPSQARAQRKALDAETGLFRRLWADERGALYRVREENLDVLAGVVIAGQERPFGRTSEELTRGILTRELPAEAFPVIADTLAGVTLAAVQLDTTLVERGDRIDLTLYWRRSGPPPRVPLEVHVRLDTPAPRNRLWAMKTSKLHRHWEQKRRGVVYRLDEIRTPLEGMFGIERWPVDRYVKDHVSLSIPRHAAMGEYELKITWRPRVLQAGSRFWDFFSDHDASDAPAVGFLEVY